MYRINFFIHYRNLPFQESEEESKCRYCPKTFSGDDCYIKQLNHEKSAHQNNANNNSDKASSKSETNEVEKALKKIGKTSSKSETNEVEKALKNNKKIGNQIQVEVVRK